MSLKHFISFFVLLGVTCWAFCRLAVVEGGHRLVGSTVEEVYKASILLHKPGTGSYYNPFDTKGLRALKEDVRMEGAGALRVLSSEMELQATMVQWEGQESHGRRKEYLSAPGLAMVARVKWEVLPSATDGDAGSLRLVFSKRISNAECEPLVLGRLEKSEDGSFVALRVAAYQSVLAWRLGRCKMALVLALPVVGLVYGIVLVVVLHFRIKKQPVIPQEQSDAGKATSYFPAPPPLDDWRQAWIIGCICCAGACIPVLAVIAQGQMLPVMSVIILSFTAAGLVAGAAMLMSRRRAALWVKMDAETISCAKGRKEPLQWQTARWEDLVQAAPGSHSGSYVALAAGAATVLTGATIPALAAYIHISKDWLRIVFPNNHRYLVTNPACVQRVNECIRARQEALSE